MAAGASALLAVGIGIAGAAPAEAAVVPIGDCNSLPQTIVGTGPQFVLFDAIAGDVLTATVSGTSNSVNLSVGPNPVALPAVAQGVAPTSLTYSFPAGGQVYARVRDLVTSATTLTVTWTCSRPAAPIPAWVQAYGRASADDDCPAGYNPTWAGGPGADVVAYTKSWQQWMNDGTGGWVCTRSIPSLG